MANPNATKTAGNGEGTAKRKQVRKPAGPKEVTLVLNGLTQQQVTEQNISVRILDPKRDYKEIISLVQSGGAVLNTTIEPRGGSNTAEQ